MSVTAVLGNFDGVHLGHRELLNRAAQYDGKTVVLTFDTLAPGFITPPPLRNDLLVRYGADDVVALPFESVRTLSPAEFCEKILKEMIGAERAVCGFNYRFGFNREGSADTLNNLFGNVDIVDRVTVGGETVSSTEIRHRIADGRFSQAIKMLGHPFIIRGKVLNGRKLGTSIGFPTANQVIEGVCPTPGAYAGFTFIDGKRFNTVTGISSTPTVGATDIHAETFIDGFSGDLYGCDIDVCITSFIRKEEKFGSVEELRNRIELDLETIRK